MDGEFILTAIQNHAIADTDQEEKIVTAMHRFVGIANSMLKNNYTGYIQQPGDNFDPFGFGVEASRDTHEHRRLCSGCMTSTPKGMRL